MLDLKQKLKAKNGELKIFSLSDFQSNQYSSQSKFVFSFPYFARNYENEYISFKESLKEIPGINQSTISHFARVWFRNYFINLDLCKNRPNTGFIFEDSFPFNGNDVLFVGAAPILEEQIPWIKANQDHFYIISSDTSCYPLLANGIRPDYILSIDAGRGTIFHFREIPQDIPIITWLGVNSYIFRLSNPILLYMSTYPLDQVLHSILFSEREITLKNPSLNVAGLAKTIAEKFMASRLILAGISFKMQSGKTHCRGSGYENYNIPRVNRYFPMESYTPHVYKKEISSKNQLALYHLTESIQTHVVKLDTASEIKTSAALYKIKPLSIKFLHSEIEKFKKSLDNRQIKKEILQKTGLEKSFYDKFVQRFI